MCTYIQLTCTRTHTIVIVYIPFHHSGSDGLMKLWTIKTSECVKTFDGHQSKVWTLIVNQDESQVITGGDDSAIIIWKVSPLRL